ncbi:hypothetical protein DLAC_04249 [Tieghemostelium lacteum]|uniref:Uncharacterized protein n=1 Tax=Tieghemostelium lacteum TaxID=361077 RepID=A0A151ZSL4_TIELA|nr:hypothetical protein DLAC_04249 [Tieghemostelium lacteum]|eukprot:KYQ96929.1 hypothetical protein DLAC_04249 [Tieghemostelium lacteum]
MGNTQSEGKKDDNAVNVAPSNIVNTTEVFQSTKNFKVVKESYDPDTKLTTVLLSPRNASFIQYFKNSDDNEINALMILVEFSIIENNIQLSCLRQKNITASLNCLEDLYKKYNLTLNNNCEV